MLLFTKVCVKDRAPSKTNTFMMQIRLKAHTLFITVVISFIIGILCSVLLLTTYLHQSQTQYNLVEEALIHNCRSGIHYALAHSSVGKEEEIIDLFAKGKDSVRIKRDYWGVYELISVTAFQNNQSRTQTILSGYPPKGDYASALYLSDHRRPLSLTGNTLIKGKAFLPEAGVKRAYIQGQGFTGVQLVQGSIQQSKEQLPTLNTAQQDYLTQLVSIASNQENEIEDTIHSFHLPTIAWQVQSKALAGVVLKGNIILRSEQALSIPSSCTLEQVIVIAPKITIQSGFKGQLQCFAKDTLIVEPNVTLSYPSSLLVSSTALRSYIVLSSNSTLYGHIGMIHTTQEKEAKAFLHIEQGATVYGAVYADAFVTLQGKIYGHASVNKFFLKTRTSIYENYLLNGIIDYSKLPKTHVNGSIFNNAEKNNQQVVQWVF